MKNREGLLFSIILLLINTAGVTGALLSSLGMDFGTVLQPGLFLCGMAVFCLLSGMLWSTRGKAEAALQWGLLLAALFICILSFGGDLAEGMGWALRGVLERLNERYDIHLIWNLPTEAELAERGMEMVMTRTTWSVLAAMLPLVLFLGYAVVRQRVVALLLADAVWFMAACTIDEFPAYVWLVLCILGLAAVVIRGAFRDDEKAGIQAVLIGAAALGVVMALVYRFAVPFMDSRYDATQEARIEMSRKINEEWIPGIKRMLARFGSGSGTDVTGQLTRKAGTAYTSDEVYRVTFSFAPKSTVYLRGFTGKDYEGDQWKAAGDSDLEKYYRSEGWELPESGCDLVNLSYDAFRYRASGKVWVEELAAPGSYTVYPYGTQLTEDYKVHWDGTAERESRSWEFLYSGPEDYRRDRKLAGTAARNEARYRDYVYDTFCEYPAEEFPKLTAFLESAGFRTGSVYDSLEDVLLYLTGNAVYNLDVPNTPRGQDFVEYFLFESREGYCAHFASSAVLILRYLGIPARYVTGYAAAPGEFSRNQDGTYSAVILDKQAHAWAEVYLEGIGWMPVEMTPGAAPFPGDNTAEQLALAGQLTGEQDSGEAVPSERNPFVGSENAAGDEESKQEESDGADKQPSGEEKEKPDREQPGSGEKPADGDEGEPDQKEPVGQEDTGQDDAVGQGGFQGSGGSLGQGSGGSGSSFGQNSGGNGSSFNQGSLGGNGGSDIVRGLEADESDETVWHRKAFDGVMAVMKGILQTLGLLLLLVILWKLTWTLHRRGSCRKLEQAESREKVFLMYRSLRRLLAVSGCAERLLRSDENTAEFNSLLEKCSFGRKEPGPEEVQAVRDFAETLAKEIYAGLPFYRKPLFAWLDVYGFGITEGAARVGCKNRTFE